jgi:hypothetical protein
MERLEGSDAHRRAARLSERLVTALNEGDDGFARVQVKDGGRSARRGFRFLTVAEAINQSND